MKTSAGSLNRALSPALALRRDPRQLPLPAAAQRVVELNQRQRLLLLSGLQSELIGEEVGVAGEHFQIAGRAGVVTPVSYTHLSHHPNLVGLDEVLSPVSQHDSHENLQPTFMPTGVELLKKTGAGP